MRRTTKKARGGAWTFVFVAFLAVLAGGCWRQQEHEVVVYTALDAEFSRPVLARFTRATGIAVLPKFDVESTKTVGLTEEILAERERPRCDVFWNNEILHTLRLERLGLLEAYQPREANRFPAQFRSPAGRWHGFAARARVLLVNNRLLAEGRRPTSVLDLADPKWQGKAAIAKPLFGTTATHAACLFAALGDERARTLFAGIRENCQVLSGNRQVARAVATGQAAWGLTDTDDAIAEVESGRPVAIVYPDQQAGGIGTLFIPNTLSILRNCPHPAEARRLVDALLTAETEAALAAGRSAQIPLHSGSNARVRIETPRTVRAMEVDFREAEARWSQVARELRELFTAP